MGVAFSGSHIVHDKEIDASTPAALVADLHAAAVAAKWPSVAIEGGYQYTLVSPEAAGEDDYRAKLRIWDPDAYLGTKKRVDLQFRSFDGLRDGVVHHLICDTGKVLQLVANICQVFISKAGLAASTGCTVCGGVPFVPDKTVAELPEECPSLPVTEAWWSVGDVHPNNIDDVDTFRRGYKLNSIFYSFDAAWNGSLMMSHTAGFPLNSPGAIRLVPRMMPTWWPLNYYPPPPTQWHNGSRMWFEPLLAWGHGNVNHSIALVRGQIWDAMWCAKDQPLDEEETIDDLDWVNWSHYVSGYAGTYCGCLYLLRGDAPGGGGGGPFHYAY